MQIKFKYNNFNLTSDTIILERFCERILENFGGDRYFIADACCISKINLAEILSSTTNLDIEIVSNSLTVMSFDKCFVISIEDSIKLEDCYITRFLFSSGNKFSHGINGERLARVDGNDTLCQPDVKAICWFKEGF